MKNSKKEEARYIVHEYEMESTTDGWIPTLEDDKYGSTFYSENYEEAVKEFEERKKYINYENGTGIELIDNLDENYDQLMKYDSEDCEPTKIYKLTEYDVNIQTPTTSGYKEMEFDTKEEAFKAFEEAKKNFVIDYSVKPSLRNKLVLEIGNSKETEITEYTGNEKDD